MRGRLGLALGLAAVAVGCDSGPSAETLVDELRVVVMRPVSPEVAPGEAVAVDGAIADPLENGFQRLTWTCTRLGSDCLEALDPAAAWTGLDLDLDPESGLIESGFVVSPALIEVASDEPAPLVQLYTLACEPGLCPVIDRAAADPAPDAAEADALRADLSDPIAMLGELPITGVSLASWSVDVSTRTVEDRREHPTLGDCLLTVDGAPVGASVALETRVEAGCPVDGAVDADAGLWGYATAGGWEGAVAEVEGDPVVADPYIWIAPDAATEAGAVDLWLVLTDGLGGLDWAAFQVEVAQ